MILQIQIDLEENLKEFKEFYQQRIFNPIQQQQQDTMFVVQIVKKEVTFYKK